MNNQMIGLLLGTMKKTVVKEMVVQALVELAKLTEETEIDDNFVKIVAKALNVSLENHE